MPRSSPGRPPQKTSRSYQIGSCEVAVLYDRVLRSGIVADPRSRTWQITRETSNRYCNSGEAVERCGRGTVLVLDMREYGLYAVEHGKNIVMIVWAIRNFGSSATICCIRGSVCSFWTIFSHNHYLHHKDLGAPYQRKEIALKSHLACFCHLISFSVVPRRSISVFNKYPHR